MSDGDTQSMKSTAPTQTPGRTRISLTMLLPLVSCIMAVVALYFLYPSSFEAVWTGTWKNRVYYLFFLWLVSLETVLNWEEIRIKKVARSPVGIATFFAALLLPTIFIVAAGNLGANTFITGLARESGVRSEWAELMPLSTEYLVLALLFSLTVLLGQGIKGLRNYSISTVFLIVIGLTYTIDNLYPFGQFSPFQIMVLPTATLAANFLTYMGYQVLALGVYGGMPVYMIQDSLGRSSPPLAIAWPCSGIESLLIYTVTILIFLKKTGISLRKKTVYFIVGAVVTYMINILRIVTIFVIAVNNGDWGLFHDYYGSLYSLSWIIAYPLIIIGAEALWRKIVTPKPTISSKTLDGASSANNTN